MQITPSGLDALYYNFLQRYQASYQRVEPWTPKIATEVPSSSRENRYPWMEQIPRMREWLGERYVHNLAARVYTLANKDFELTMGVARNDIDDDNLGLYAPTLDQMGWQAKKWPDDVMIQVLQAGVTSLAFDGQWFFDTDHPLNMDDSTSSTYANLFTAKPLTPANYNTVRAAMMTVNAADGKPLSVTPNILLVDPSNEIAAKQILNAEMIAPTGAFGINAAGGFQTNILRGTAELVVAPELANQPGIWYLLDCTKPIKPFIWQVRKPPVFASLTAPDDQNVFWRKEYIYGVDSRGNGGFTLPFLAARVEPT